MDQTSNRGLRKAARISGTLLVAFILIVAIAVLIDSWGKPGPGLSTFNKIMFFFEGVGAAGLVLALWKECCGGSISFLGFLVFNILAAFNPTPGSGYTIFLLLPIVPSILYLTWCWKERKSKNKTAGT